MPDNQVVQILRSSDGSHREFITWNTRICEMPSAIFYKPFDQKEQVAFEYIGDYGQQIVKKLMDDPGVEKISMRAESIQIDRLAGHSWDSLETLALKTLKSVLGHELRPYSDIDAMSLQTTELVKG